MQIAPGYWMYQVYNRLTDPFGDTIRDPKTIKKTDIYNGRRKYMLVFSLKTRPHFFARIFLWPVVQFTFDPARMYTTDYIPDNLDFIIAPALEVLEKFLKSSDLFEA